MCHDVQNKYQTYRSIFYVTATVRHFWFQYTYARFSGGKVSGTSIQSVELYQRRSGGMRKQFFRQSPFRPELSSRSSPDAVASFYDLLREFHSKILVYPVNRISSVEIETYIIKSQCVNKRQPVNFWSRTENGAATGFII